MEYTNKHNLPKPVRQWLENDEYDYHPGVFSATRLLKPARMVVLEKRHETELVQDLSDVIASRYGTALHDSFENVKMKDCIQEIRFFAEIGGEKVSGKPDILEIDGSTLILWDIKSTSIWTYIYKSREEDYRIQLSVYRWVVMHGDPECCINALNNDPPVSINGKIIYLFTDWSKKQSKEGGNYPPIRVVIENVKMMSTEETEAWILGRLNLFNHFINNPQESLPRCTNTELWRRPQIMKQGRKTPVKKFQTEEEAMRFLKSMDDDHYFEWGEVNRCNYCLVSRWCEQFKEMKAQGIIAEE